MQPGR